MTGHVGSFRTLEYAGCTQGRSGSTGQSSCSSRGLGHWPSTHSVAQVQGTFWPPQSLHRHRHTCGQTLTHAKERETKRKRGPLFTTPDKAQTRGRLHSAQLRKALLLLLLLIIPKHFLKVLPVFLSDSGCPRTHCAASVGQSVHHQT